MLQPAGSSCAASIGSGCMGLSRQASAQPSQGGCLSPSAPATPQQQGEAISAPGQQEDEAPSTRATAVGAPDAEAPAEHRAPEPSASPAATLVSPAAPQTPGAAATTAAAAGDGQQLLSAAHGGSKGALEAGSPPCSSPAHVPAPPRVQPPHSPSPDPIAEQARQCCTDRLRLCTHACLRTLRQSPQLLCSTSSRQRLPAQFGRRAAGMVAGLQRLQRSASDGVTSCLKIHRQNSRSLNLIPTQRSGAGAAGSSRGGEVCFGAGERAAAPREHQPAGAAVVHRAAAARR